MTRMSRGGIHWFVFWGSEWSSLALLRVAQRFELLESLLEPFLSSFQMNEPLLLLNGCGSPIFAHDEWGLNVI